MLCYTSVPTLMYADEVVLDESIFILLIGEKL